MKISTKIINVPLSKIKEDPNQPRQHFTETMIEEMATSVRNEGIINPIEIDKDFIIITGAIRFKAAKVVGLEVIPCKSILEIGNSERFIRQMQENVHHNTMNDWDVAKGLEKTISLIRSQCDGKKGRPSEIYRDALIKLYGKSAGWISGHLSLLSESKEIQKSVQKREISFYKIREAKKAPEEYREKLKKKVIKDKYIPVGGVSMIASGLNRAKLFQKPETAKKLLEEKYIDDQNKPMSEREITLKVENIIPSTQTILEKDIDRVKLITAKSIELGNLLEENPLASIKEPLSKASLTFQLKILMLIIDKYLHQQAFVKQLEDVEKSRVKLLKEGEK